MPSNSQKYNFGDKYMSLSRIIWIVLCNIDSPYFSYQLIQKVDHLLVFKLTDILSLS